MLSVVKNCLRSESARLTLFWQVGSAMFSYFTLCIMDMYAKFKQVKILMKIVRDLKINNFIQKIIKIFNNIVLDILCYSWLVSLE